MTIYRSGRPNETETIYICHGGEHDLSIVADPDSPWVGQGVGILNATDQSPLPFNVEPRVGEFHELKEAGAKWKIFPPAEGENSEFYVWVRSEYTAKPFVIPVSLGHHRLEIAETRRPVRFPVVRQQVTAQINVVSHYTKKPVKDVKVVWYLDGTPLEGTFTNEGGWYSCTFIPENIGEQTLSASVESKYYEGESPIKTHFTFNVLETSLWQQARLEVNELAVDLSAQDVVLIRGKKNELKLKLEGAREMPVVLSISEVDQQLNIDASPGFDIPQPILESDEAVWVITPGAERSGYCKLRLSSPELAGEMEVVCRVLAERFIDEVEAVEVDGVNVLQHEAIFYRGQAKKITIIFKSDSPLAGFPVIASCDLKSGLESNDVTSVPTFDSSTKLNLWRITGSTNKSGTFQLSFGAIGVPVSLLLPINMLISSNLADEGTVKIGEEDVPSSGFVFYRAKPETVDFLFNQGSPLLGRPIIARCKVKSGLFVPDVVSSPKFDEPSTVYRWTIVGSEIKSGAFQLSFEMREIPTPLSLPISFLISIDLHDEVVVTFGNIVVPKGDPVVTLRGRQLKLRLESKAGSPLEACVPILNFTAGSGLSSDDVTCKPGYGIARSTKDWEITGASNRSGSFKFRVTWARMPFELLLPAFLLSENIEDEAVIKFNGEEVSLDTLLRFTRGISGELTLEPRSGSPIASCPLIQFYRPTDHIVVACSPDYGIPTTGLKWVLTPPSGQKWVFWIDAERSR